MKNKKKINSILILIIGLISGITISYFAFNSNSELNQGSLFEETRTLFQESDYDKLSSQITALETKLENETRTLFQEMDSYFLMTWDRLTTIENYLEELLGDNSIQSTGACDYSSSRSIANIRECMEEFEIMYSNMEDENFNLLYNIH